MHGEAIGEANTALAVIFVDRVTSKFRILLPYAGTHYDLEERYSFCTNQSLQLTTPSTLR